MGNENPVLDWLEEHGVESCVFEPYEIGKSYYFRCAVYSVVGRVVAYSMSAKVIKLENASYVGTDGRYGDAVRNGFGENAELEYVDEQFVNIDAICDFVPYKHELPTKDQ